MANLDETIVDVALFVLASPVYAYQAFRKLQRKHEFFRMASANAVTCECGSPVSLVGMWRCSCGFTYRGHLLRVCPVCKTLPSVVRCFRCGVTIKLPEP